MSKLSARTALVLAGLGLICFCSMEPPVASGSSSTGNARIAGVVVDSAGKPLAGATVAVLREVTLTAQGTTADGGRSATTAADGSFLFSRLPAARYLLHCTAADAEVESLLPSSAALAKIVLESDSSVCTTRVTVRRPVTLRGTVVVDSGVGLQDMLITVPGTGRNVSPDIRGAYELAAVPRGGDIAFITPAAVNCLPLDTTETAGDTLFVRDVAFATAPGQAAGEEGFYASSLAGAYAVVPLEQQVKALLFNDFDGPLSPAPEYTLHNMIATLLPRPGGASDGRWTVRSQSDWHEIWPATFLTNFTGCLVAEGAFRGKSLFFGVDYAEGHPPTGGIGVDICQPDSFYDLSAMTELSMYVRGSGELRVVFHTDTVARSGLGEGEYIYDFSLPASWQRVSVKSADLLARPGTQASQSGLTWQSASRGVTAISFMALTNDTVHLDDLYLFGLSAADIRPSSPGSRMK